MNLVFIYLGEECLVITYSASCATMCLVGVISGPDSIELVCEFVIVITIALDSPE